MFDVYGTTIIDSDATAPFSAPTVWKARLEALADTAGISWNTTRRPRIERCTLGCTGERIPQFQGRIVGNKLFFLSRTEGLNGVFLFGNDRLSNGSANLLFVANTSGVGNQHILGTNDPGAAFPPERRGRHPVCRGLDED
jgi:hypothetical protein